MKTTEVGGDDRGYDGGKKIKGRKRHLLVDTLGLLVAVLITGANIDDGTATTAEIKKRRFPDDFKREAVRLVTEEKYTFQAAADAVGVCQKSLRDWHAKFAPQPAACGADATLAELHEENKRLRQQLKRAELEREILKKATAYFAKESL